MYCQECGSVLDQNARFCQSCGKPESPASSPAVPTTNAPQVSRQDSPPRQRPQSKILWLIMGGIILAVIVAIIVRSQSDSSNSPTHTSAVPDASPQPQIVRSSIPPPKFRIYKFKIGEPISVVVPPKTTDEQLKSLLWFFREKIRAHQLKEIGLMQATADDENSGTLAVYRGEKCANENYISNAGPCGNGDHDDAYYQWGIEADPSKDTGGIRVKGDEIVVFDYKDEWQADGTSKELERKAASGTTGDGGEAKPDKMTYVVIDGGASIARWRVGNSKLCNWHVNASDYRNFLICPANSIAAENEIIVSDFTPEVLISYPDGLGPSSPTPLNCTRYSDRSGSGSVGPYLDCH